MKDKYLPILLALIMITAPTLLCAQSTIGQNWYFGGSTNGIQFNRSDNSANLIPQTPLSPTGGSAVANDPATGNLVFYTDGNTVYDITNTAMPNGKNLGGNTAGNQPVVITRVPGQSNQYYVIVNNAVGQVSSRIIDISLFGNATFPTPAIGDGTSATNSIVGSLSGRAEAMIVIPHSNGTDSWLITQAAGTNNYTITLIDVNGIGVTAVTQPGPLGLITNVANFSYHPATGNIAVSPQEVNRNVEVLKFDNTTGTFSFVTDVPNTSVATSTGQATYDTEWSSSGEFLYISRSGGAGVQADLLQFDMLNPTISLTSVLPQPNTIARSYGLQMAPDSAIYHLYQATAGGPFFLGKLLDSDTVAAETNYVQQAFLGNKNFNAQQFPSFSPSTNLNLQVSFTANGFCANAPTSFYPTVTPGADSVRWDFGDGTGTSSDWSPIYTYQAGGGYSVSLTAFLNGESETATLPITINAFDTQISLVQDTTACSCELPFPKAANPPPPCNRFTLTAQVQGGSPTYQWYGPGGPIPGATSTTLSPDSAGYYYLVATVGTCQAYAGVNIKEYGIQDQRANVWYFGDKAGIDFNSLFDTPPNPNAPVAISNPVMNAPEGTSTISDRNGQVVFFTDGSTVWNRQFVPIATGIGGDPTAAQSVIIMPVPGDETLYYIFTTQEVYGTNTYELRYTLFDLKLNNGSGGIVDPDGDPSTTELSTVLFTKSTERLTASPNWLIAHEFGNNTFRAYQISAQGINAPVISSIGSDHNITYAPSGQGYMKLSPQNVLAVALPVPGGNTIELFDFDPATGVISDYHKVDLNEPTGLVYGLEFSPSGQKLYASTIQGSKLFELAYDSVAGTYVTKPALPPVSPPGEIGAIQIGPDGNIYVAANNSSSLGTISPIDDVTTPSVFTANGKALLGGTQSKLGLPNFIQNLGDPIQSPGISVTGVCLGDSTFFTGSATDVIDTLSWFFGDGAGQKGAGLTDVSHVYANAGTYTVTLIISNRCAGVVATLTQQVTIVAPPAPPTFLPPGQFPVLCNGPLTLEATPATNPDLANLTFLWSSGETTRTIVASQQNNYSVTITNASGCTSDGSLIVADNRPIVDLGPDQTICENTTVAALDAQNPGFQYAWTLNGAAIGTAQTQQVNTSLVPAPVKTYAVVVTDPVTQCKVTSDITYTIKQVPALTLNNTNSTCGNATGIINLTITAPSSTFSYTIGSLASGSNQPANNIITVNNVAGGNYPITATDQISGCATNSFATINDSDFNVTATQVNNCDPITLQVAVAPNTGTPTAPVSYRVLENGTLQVVETGNNKPLSFGTNNPLTDNQTYVVEVTDAGGCIASSAGTPIDEDPKVPATFTIDGCSSPITITASQGDTFAWSGSNIVPATATLATMEANPTPGSQVYNVKITQPSAGFCALDTALTVVVQQPFDIKLSQTDACIDQVVVTADVTPSGNYLYRWSRNGVYDQTIAGPQVVALPVNNNQLYKVTLYNPVNGCTADKEQRINVFGVLTVSLSATAACEGQPFTLTATSNRLPDSDIFKWYYEGGILNELGTRTQVTTGKSGKYSVELSTNNVQCKATADINIIAAPVTAGSLPDFRRICPDPANPDPATREVVLDPGAEFVTVQWSKDGLPLGISTPTLTVDDEGLYSAALTNSFGCPSSDKTEVAIDCDPVIVGPNAFRPSSTLMKDGDAINQSFRLFTFFIDEENFQVFIFNRWGEMVFQSNQRDFKWNGGYNNNLGQLLPAGTYSYVVRYKSSYQPEAGVKEKRGGVVLMR